MAPKARILTWESLVTGNLYNMALPTATASTSEFGVVGASMACATEIACSFLSFPCGRAGGTQAMEEEPTSENARVTVRSACGPTVRSAC